MAIGTTAAILGGAAIGGIGSVIAGKSQQEGIEGASDATLQGTRESIASQERQLERLIELQEPFREAGITALPQLSEFAGQDITETPAYQLQQEEGEEAINRAAAARGGFGGSSTVERLGEFNRRLMASETDKQFGRLLNLVDIGRGAATTQGSAGMQTGANIGATTMQGAGNLANLSLMGGQSRASTYSNLGALPLQTLGSLSQAGVFGQATPVPQLGTVPQVDTGAFTSQYFGGP